MPPFTNPEHVLTTDILKILEKTTGIGDRDAWVNIFFLLSKSEHDNQRPENTFETSKGTSVFFFAKRLPYDGEQRGVTVGFAGWTTANDGNDKHGDFSKLGIRYKKLGGVDLRKLSKGLTKDKDKADDFCKKIQSLHGEYADLFVQAQFEDLCHTNGYIYEAVHGLKKAGIENPSPLALAAVIDTLINQGIGGKWCPVKWLEAFHAEHKNAPERKILREFLKWKKVAATKNEHNDPPSNGEKRSQMFIDLLDDDGYDLPTALCEKVVTWTMK